MSLNLVCIIYCLHNHQNSKIHLTKFWLERTRGGNIVFIIRARLQEIRLVVVVTEKSSHSNVTGSPVPSSSEWTADYDDWDVTGGRTGWYSVLSNGSVPAILMPQNHSHDLPPTPSPEQIKQMEEETHRQFELLKVSVSIFRFEISSKRHNNIQMRYITCTICYIRGCQAEICFGHIQF
jgi:hypothetical protein